MNNKIEVRFQQELARTPDPMQFAMTFPTRMQQAIAVAQTPEEISNLRALAKMGDEYLRQALPKVVQDRHERFLLMHPTEWTYIEASGKAGALWRVHPERRPNGGDRKSKKFQSERFRTEISPVQAGFKNDRDSVTCERISEIDPQDLEIYRNECLQNERHSTLAGAERIWHLLNQKSTPELPDGKYRVIYADPPWKYASGDQHSTEEQDTVIAGHYWSMSIQELCDLPVKDMAQDDSVLFMWVTSPLLDECFEVIDAWGFEYKASIVWNKDAHNVGHYVSVRHEFLLICTRGSCTPDIDQLLPSVVTEKRTEHSVKPETFRGMIDTMYPNGKRIELFARRPAEGWEVWGNEII